ncbi:response regulator transcription factor [Nocardioides deserti]|uniref:Helix-turn-helix transcriptional regulator n=1 Tax=Nocardioides deserti TaxID=1588644 RepID=A0ABR6U396_9ACTN|nr:helix-turn-helix transcriptional regulator [Nocardioides deserti]MBC2958875.1 helix-turn-helix transcriptional regulator [Nocardioides deserti]GGO69392.1 hypothetical protein GCM10012276_05480 [Nocardioides deserti]
MDQPTRIGVLSGFEIIRTALATLLHDHVVVELDAPPWPADLDLVVFDRHACATQRHALTAAHGLVRLALLDDQRAGGPPTLAQTFATGGVIPAAASNHEIRDAILRAAREEDLTVADNHSQFDPALRLSGQEERTLRLVAAGLSNVQIATEMLIGVNTVKVYVRQAYRKIGVVRRSQAVAWVYGQQRHSRTVEPEASV